MRSGSPKVSHHLLGSGDVVEGHEVGVTPRDKVLSQLSVLVLLSTTDATHNSRVIRDVRSAIPPGPISVSLSLRD